MKQAWFRLMASLAGVIHAQKQSLVRKSIVKSIFALVYILILEVFLGFLALPIYLFFDIKQFPTFLNQAGCSYSLYRMRRRVSVSVLVPLVAMISAYVFMANFVFAATYSWDGDAGDGLWSSCTNWSSDTCPGSGDYAQFGSGSDSIQIDSNIDVYGIDINSGFSGTITQNAGVTVTVGAGNFDQAGGTFVGGDSAIAISGQFQQTAGTFTGTSGVMSMKTNFYQTGGTFNHNGGTIELNSNGNTYINVASSLTIANLTVNKSSGSYWIHTYTGDTLTVTGTAQFTEGYYYDAWGDGNISISDCDALTFASTWNSNGSGRMTVTGGTGTTTIPDGTVLPQFTWQATNCALDFTGSDARVYGQFVMSDGTLEANTANLDFDNTFTFSGGTYNGGSGTDNFDSTVNISGGSIDFDSGTVTFQSSAAYTQSAGTVDMTDVDSADFNHNFDFTGGTFYAPATTAYFEDAFRPTGGTFHHNSGTIELNGNANSYIDVPTSLTIANFTVNKGSGSYWIHTYTGDTLTVTGTAQFTEGYYYDAWGDGNISIPDCSLLNFASTWNSNGAGRMTVTGGTGTTTIPDGTVLPQFTWQATNCALDFTGSSARIYAQFVMSDGTLEANSANLDFDNTFTFSGGTYNGGSGTDNFDSTVNISGGSIDFDSGTVTFQSSAAYTQSAGTVDMTDVDSADFNNNYDFTGGTFYAPLTTAYFEDAFRPTGGTFHHNSGTIELNGNANSYIDVPTSLTLANLTVNKGSGSYWIHTYTGDTLTVTGTAQFTEGYYYDAWGDGNISISDCDALTFASTWNSNGSGRMTVTGGTGTTTIPDGTVLPQFTWQATNCALDFTGSDARVYGQFVMSDGTLEANTANLDFDNTFTFSGGTYNGGSGTDNFDSTVNISGGSIDFDSGTVTFQSSATYTQSAGTVDMTDVDSADFNNNFDLSGGTFYAPAATAYFEDAFRPTGGTFHHNSGTIELNGNANSYIDVPTSLTIANFTVNKGSTSYWYHMYTGDTLYVTGTSQFTQGYFYNAWGNGVLEAQGDIVVNSSYTANQSGDFRITGSANQTWTGNHSSGSGDWIKTTINKSDGILTTSGTLRMAAANFTYTAATTTYASSTFYFVGTMNLDGEGTSGRMRFDNMHVNSGTVTLTGDLEVDGDLYIDGGTLTTGGNDMWVGGDLYHPSGTFTHGSNTVTFDGGNQTIYDAITFNNFTKTTTTAALTLTLPADETVAFAGTMTLNGADGYLLSLRSTSDGTQAEINPQGTRTISYLDAKDNNNVNGTTIETDGLNITHSGNLTNWAFTSTLQFNASSSSGAESVSSANIPISMSLAVGEVTVDYTVTSGTADNTDFTLASGTATITSGDTSTTIPLVIVGDGIYEKNESVVITLSNASGATLGTTTKHVYTITDDDSPIVNLTTANTFTQTNWDGGVGTNTTTQYSAASGLITTTTGKAYLGGGGLPGDWYDAAWSYRNSFTVTEQTAAELTNFQVKVTVPYDADMQSDFDDIRFTDSDGTTLLDHWLESKTDSDTADVWIEIPTLEASEAKTIYIYYGNAGAASASAIGDTFDFGDDFSGGSIDETKWTITDATGWSVSGGVLNGSNTTGKLTSVSTFSDGVILECKNNTASLASNGHAPCGFFSGTSNGVGWLFHGGTNYYRNNASWVPNGSQITAGLDVLMSVTAKSSSQVDMDVINYATEASIKDVNNLSNTVSSEPIRIGTRQDNSYTGQSYDSDWDWIRVRKYASTDPTVSTFGTEEEGNAMAATGSLTSATFDTGTSTHQWGVAWWTADIGITTTVKMRTDSSSDMSGATAWASCDAVTNGADITGNGCVNDGDQYLEYQVTMNQINGTSSIFHDISIQYLATSTQTADESALGTVTITATLASTTSDTVEVPFTVSGSATNPADHDLASSGSITISAGNTTSVQTFDVVNDSAFETDETVVISMGSPTSATAGTFTIVTVNIVNDDSVNVPGAPTVTASSTTALNLVIDENGNPGTTQYRLCQTTDTTSCVSSGYVQANGTLDTSSSTWQTYSTWGGSNGFDITGLTTNTAYQFLVQAQDGGSTTSLSNANTAVYTLAPQVTSVSISNATVTNTYQLQLTWTDTGQDGLRIERDADCDDSYTTIYNNASVNETSPSTTATNLIGNTCYQFRFAAYNGDGSLNTTSMPVSNQITTPPAQPTGLSTQSVDTTNIIWQWNAVTAADSYNVYDNNTQTLLGNTASTQYLQTEDGNGQALSSSGEYSVIIRAVSTGNGTGVASSQATATTDPSAPTNLGHSSNTTTSITWTWQGDVSSTFYARDANNVLDNTGGFVTATTWLQTALSANTAYTLEVRSQNQVGQNSSFVSVARYTSQNAPEALTFSNVSASAITVAASGTFPNLGTGSSVISFDNNAGDTQSITSGNSWTNSDLSPNTEYTYDVSATNGDGDATVSTTDAQYTLAAVPGQISATVGTATGSLNLTLDANSNPTNTNVRLYETTAEAFVDNALFTLTGNDTDYDSFDNWGTVTVTGLSPNAAYQFIATARNDDLVVTASSTASAAVYTRANVPSGFSASSVGPRELTVTWGANSNPAGTEYYVEDRDAPSRSSGWTTAQSYTFGDLTPATVYNFRVKARNTDNVETDYLTASGIETNSSGSGARAERPELPAGSQTTNQQQQQQTQEAPASQGEEQAEQQQTAQNAQSGSETRRGSSGSARSYQYRSNANESEATVTIGEGEEETQGSVSFRIKSLFKNILSSVWRLALRVDPVYAAEYTRNEVTLRLKKGESKEADINGDRIMDVRVKYLGLEGGEPQYHFTYLTNSDEWETAVNINGGAYETTSRIVLLFLNVTNATEVAISDSEDFTAATFIPYQPFVPWTLSDGEGEKKVYVRFKTESGGVAVAYDTISFVSAFSLPTDETDEQVVTVNMDCLLPPHKAYKSSMLSDVYYITSDCTKRHFPNMRVFHSYFDSVSDIQDADQVLLESIPMDEQSYMVLGPRRPLRSGSLIKTPSSPNVYLLIGNKIHWVVSEAVFSALQFSWQWIDTISEEQFVTYMHDGAVTTSSLPDGTIFSYHNQTTTYQLVRDEMNTSTQRKRQISHPPLVDQIGYEPGRVLALDEDVVFEDGEPLELIPTEPEVMEPPTPTRFITDVGRGDRGDAVVDLQQRLRELGFFTYPRNTGYFGNVTVRAVNAYRDARGLAQTGVVDLPMRILLDQEPS